MKRPFTGAASATLGVVLALTFGLLGAGASAATPLPSRVPTATYNDAFAKKTHDLINAERAKAGVRQLAWNQRIADVSQDWANKLGVAMVSPTFDWAKIHRPDAGGSLIPPGATMYRENIGINSTPEQIVSWWMGSAGHRAAMLDARLTDAGLGYSVPASGPYAGLRIVVSNLAAYSSTTAPPVAPTPAPGTTAIALKAAQLGGAFGAATTGEIYGLRNGGGYQCFQRGCIVYSPATGARLSFGGIRTVWAASGSENGILGYPTTDEVSGLRNGGVHQLYQGGAIVWSPATGGQISTGGIRTVWLANGAENGNLGYPTSNEITGLRNGGVQQTYQGGAIIWSPANGGYVSIGGIRTLWAATGYENGRLGYPTSNEYATYGGGVAQNYQGGVIFWSPTGGVRVSYK
ncbi:CAP domain-containing protein [Pseudarthrobacter sp. J75]|uniref:CAP domain-containing protein n=1 Tax=unclassified Pseudarthrobacter TaxID=2647000 RepID=UPI002E81996F|nr:MULTISPECIES: CAP domain-containing protein [unclassified Pseudarthrobacter]MEE2522412.1 CAP domain-containing protein [Pseudarthrobacter sp. J47]MEE2529257.1 CAP domain-containing protein [Pseudarthrobacter sp. J75]MEE2570927.1 CAP domain-containing protein [Pseudarthrobacter sp. J64]